MIEIVAFCVLAFAAYAAWRAFRALHALQAARSASAPAPKMSVAQKKMMGFETPADQKVPIRVGDWDAMRLALWRSKVAWGITARTAEEIIERCQHVPGCPGATVETEPCRAQCPDRETRMSALVVLNAARMHAPVDARQPADGPYFAPSREYFSEVLATLATTQMELAAFHEVYGPLPSPPVVEAPQLETTT